jgi:hypothetical protein
MPLAEMMGTQQPAGGVSIHTGTISGDAVAIPLTIPVTPEEQATGGALALLRSLGGAGTCEPSVAASAEAMLGEGAEAAARRSAVLQENVFVLLGGTSELGPYLPLVRAGATVVAVSRPGAKLSALVRTARATAAGCALYPSSWPCVWGVAWDSRCG